MDPVLLTAMMDWPPLLPAEMHIVGNCWGEFANEREEAAGIVKRLKLPNLWNGRGHRDGGNLDRFEQTCGTALPVYGSASGRILRSWKPTINNETMGGCGPRLFYWVG